jgi:hypothetical protein
MAREPVVPAEAGTQSRQHHFGTICMIRLCSGLGPSLRWDDEYLRFREVPIYKLMVEKWNNLLGSTPHDTPAAAAAASFGRVAHSGLPDALDKKGMNLQNWFSETGVQIGLPAGCCIFG